MKEFDIELAKQGHPVCTRDGRKVRVLCYDALTEDGMAPNPIVALVLEKDETERETVYCYQENGKYYSDEKSYCDLMMASQKHEGWVNIYAYAKTGTKHAGEKIFNTEKDAKIYGTECTNYLTTVKIEWEE